MLCISYKHNPSAKMIEKGETQSCSFCALCRSADVMCALHDDPENSDVWPVGRSSKPAKLKKKPGGDFWPIN